MILATSVSGYLWSMAASDGGRYERERAFHDRRFANDERAADRFYNASIDRALEAYFARLAARAAPADALDYGCGAEALTALHLARQGHRVTAVDLSPVAIEQARARAESLWVAERIDFRVGNGEALDFGADAFDLVAGTGVLHHVDLNAAYGEIARILRPGGEAMFIEPLGHNPVVNFYRDRTPDQRTPDEHPLLMEDFELARRWFGPVDVPCGSAPLRHHAPGDADDDRVVGHVIGDHAVRSDGYVATDGHRTHDLGTRADVDAVADDRHAGTPAAIRVAERDALTDVAVAADADSRVDDDPAVMADVEALADLRGDRNAYAPAPFEAPQHQQRGDPCRTPAAPRQDVAGAQRERVAIAGGRQQRSDEASRVHPPAVAVKVGETHALKFVDSGQQRARWPISSGDSDRRGF